MKKQLLRKVIALVVFSLSQIAVGFTFAPTEYRYVFYALFTSLGVSSILLLRKAFDYSLAKYTIIFMKLDKVLFVFEFYYATCLTFTLDKSKKFDFLVVFFGAIDFTRNCLSMIFKRTFFSKNEFKNYKNVIEFERLILKSKYGYKEYSDMFITHYIKDNASRYDPRVLFCLWTDDDDTRCLYKKEDALALIKLKIHEKEEEYQNDINALAEARSKANKDQEDSSDVSIASNQTAVDQNEDETTNIEVTAAINETYSATKANKISRRKNTKTEDSSTDFLYDFFSVNSDPQSSINTGDRFKNSVFLKDHLEHNIDEPIIIDCTTIGEVEKIKSLYPKTRCKKIGQIYRVRINPTDFISLIQEDEHQLNGKITKESLKCILTEEDAKLGMKLITQNFEREIGYEDFYDNMRQLNNERSAFIKFLQENKNIKRLIDFVFIVLQVVLFSFFVLGVFTWESQKKSILLPVIIFIVPGLWYGILPFLFLIYHKPFEIGDRVIINDDTLIVQELNLCYTRFERWNNDYVILNNEYLTTQTILNVKRSNYQLITLQTLISNKTTNKQIDIFRKSMKSFVKNASCMKTVQTLCTKLVDSNYYQLTINIRHSINHQNPFFTWKTQNLFMREMVRLCNKFQISFDPLTIFYTNENKEDRNRFKNYLEQIE
ncbi:MSL4 [Ecytonucleospora hepatopenaei]|uniref:MSL4 n=1 Tax=Ecytonucleospora hepatopenaei TaxID=646526 RepID=A0A1W0E8P1_9MICR|nr:MSL4 [Ecytonucleospora hepatopenaei]